MWLAVATPPEFGAQRHGRKKHQGMNRIPDRRDSLTDLAPVAAPMGRGPAQNDPGTSNEPSTARSKTPMNSS